MLKKIRIFFLKLKHRFSKNYLIKTAEATRGPHAPGCSRTHYRVYGTELDVRLEAQASYYTCTCSMHKRFFPKLRSMKWDK